MFRNALVKHFLDSMISHAKRSAERSYQSSRAIGIFNVNHYHHLQNIRLQEDVVQKGVGGPVNNYSYSSCHRRGLASQPSSETGSGGKEGEVRIKSVLQKSFPSASNIIVEDISGGCGSMFQVFVEAKEFQGLSIVKQHQLVNKALKDEIKDMHGIRIQTQPPKG